MENDELLHKWVNGTISAEELTIFRQRPEYESLANLYKNTEDLAVPEIDGAAMLSNVLQRPKGPSAEMPEKKSLFLRPWIRYAAAALVLVLAGWFYWSSSNQLIRYDLAKGERKEGVLPDQSTFLLNAASSLTYNPKGWERERTLQLEGEAFFEVKKGSAFVVETKNGSVQVLGTKFNVRSRKEMLEVQCQHGRVAVLAADGAIIDNLTANDAIRVVEGKVQEKWQMPPADKVSWATGISKFKKVPLVVVLEELERQYDIKIIDTEVNTATIVSCNFQHEDIELALRIVLTPLDIAYEIRGGNEVYLYQK